MRPGAVRESWLKTSADQKGVRLQTRRATLRAASSARVGAGAGLRIMGATGAKHRTDQKRVRVLGNRT